MKRKSSKKKQNTGGSQAPKKTKEPSLKQRRAFYNYITNGGNAKKALRDAGYSWHMQNSPHKVTKTEQWQAMLNQVDDWNLLTRLQELTQRDDTPNASLKAIDMLLKLKDRYPSQKIQSLRYEERVSHILEPEQPEDDKQIADSSSYGEN